MRAETHADPHRFLIGGSWVAGSTILEVRDPLDRQLVARVYTGAVIVNDATDYRLDAMPFGGTKLSRIGREGIRFAIQEMTETRVVCLNL